MSMVSVASRYIVVMCPALTLDPDLSQHNQRLRRECHHFEPPGKPSLEQDILQQTTCPFRIAYRFQGKAGSACSSFSAWLFAKDRDGGDDEGYSGDEDRSGGEDHVDDEGHSGGEDQ